MGNVASITNAERVFMLSEAFEGSFTRKQAEDILFEHVPSFSKSSFGNIKRAGYIEFDGKPKGRKFRYRISHTGRKVAIEFEKIIDRCAPRCGYELP